jgi:cob(I)alamin adenosyltransferase
MMDPLSISASVAGLITLTGSCLKLSRKWIGPSEFGTSDLKAIEKALYEFNGAMKTFETHLKIHEDDVAWLNSLNYLKPALDQCNMALEVIKKFVGGYSFIGKHVI